MKQFTKLAKLKFPKDFWWGVAYSAHQTEGNNYNNDWWQWEKAGKVPDRSGRACESWQRYRNDHKLVEQLGVGAFRLSLEWSRIEPKEGQFDQAAIRHYRKVLQSLRKRRIKPVVTLWHWTLPLWLTQKYQGWHNREIVALFERYCQKVMEELGEEIDLLLTFNEPRLPLNKGYLVGQYPPGKRNIWQFWQARKNMIKAHKRAYLICKQIRKGLPVGITQYCNDFNTEWNGFLINKLIRWVEQKYNWHFFKRSKGCHDFIGINYYQGFTFQLKKPFFKMRKESLIFAKMKEKFAPIGIYEVLMSAKKHFPHQPIYIFENGASDSEDLIRKRYIKEHLRQIHRAIRKGVPVAGYFHWSLLDNFEWQSGYGPKFGLCAVDRNTMQRTPKKSFYYYQKIAQKNELDLEAEV